MKRHLSVLFISYFLLTACHHTTSEQKALLVQADGLIAARPDSALHLLKKIGYYNYLSSPDRARYALLMTQALDKCDSVVESDSLIQVATDYYGKGDPVHAGYAWFYRSRCENNRGDAQEQAKALLKAQEYATQSKDYKLLGFVYGDKATIFQQQNQVDSMLHYNLLAYSNLKKAGDKRNCIVCLLIIGYSHYLNKQYEAALKYADLAFNECDNTEPLLITSIHRQQCLTY
jgi:tetratricopeptide (TPR) repeat protein